VRELFDIVKHNFDPDGERYIRPSVRGIIIKDGKIALVHSIKYDYYKFPGGGKHPDENNTETLIREVREETGLSVIAGSIREYGHVLRMEKGNPEDIFVQDNYYYFCETLETEGSQELDDYEADESFTLEWVNPEDMIVVNDRFTELCKGKTERPYVVKSVEAYRDARVMRMLIEEGFVTDNCILGDIES